jgi:membrane protein
VSFLDALYWPVAPLLTILSLTSLFHISAPLRTPWRRDLPGALLTLTIWFGGSYVIRWIIAKSVGGTSIYGPLAAPIVLMIWLYVLAIAVLIGAALNAAVETLWPVRDAARARAVVAAVEPPSLGRETPGLNPPPNRTPADNPLAPLGEQH